MILKIFYNNFKNVCTMYTTVPAGLVLVYKDLLSLLLQLRE